MITLEELEKRLKALEDVEEIKQLHIKYILALNHQNFEEMIEYFTEDCILDFVHQPDGHREGKEEAAKFFRAMAKRHRETKVWKGGQILVHPIISVDGDTAKGNWTWWRIVGPPQRFIGAGETAKGDFAKGLEVYLQTPYPGFYTMEYRRVDGKWKFSKMHLIVGDWPGDQWPK